MPNDTITAVQVVIRVVVVLIDFNCRISRGRLVPTALYRSHYGDQEYTVVVHVVCGDRIK